MERSPERSPERHGEQPALITSPFGSLAFQAAVPAEAEGQAVAEAGTPYTPFPTSSNVPSPLGRRACYTDLQAGHSFSRVPSLFARNEDRSKLAGAGAALPTEQPVGAASPTTVRKDKLHRTFKLAKIQVDREVDGFLEDARATLAAEVEATGSPTAASSRLEGIVMIAERCQSEDVDTFRETIHTIVDQLEDLRRSCTVRSHKALATRLLFILTRCSRLVMSEECAPRGGAGGGGGTGAAYMTVQPRSKGPGKLRRFSGFPLLRNQASLDEEKEGPLSPRSQQQLLRSSTAPSRSFKEALQGLHHLRLQEPRAAPPLSPMPESPSQLRSPASDTSTVCHTRPVGLSPLGRSVVTALEAELEQAAGEETPTAAAAAGPGSTAGASVGGSSPATSPSKEKRSLLTLLKQQFRSLAGRRDSGELSDTDASDMSRDGTEGFATPRIMGGKQAAAGQQQQQREEAGALDLAAGMRQGGANHVPALPAIFVPRQLPSPGRRTMSADVEALSRPRSIHPGLARQLTVHVPPGSSPGATPRLVSLCHICHEHVQTERLQEHILTCARLDPVCKQDHDPDATLTRLGNLIEDRLAERSLGGAAFSDMEDLLLVCRQAASLQPDGTKQPVQRCEDLVGIVQSLLEQGESLGASLEAEAEVFAFRVRLLVQRKLGELQSTLPAGLSDVGSGSSTPHAPSSMSIDDFEIIKPISRGAFGRVYLARKRGTGDLYAIKVMRKVDLIRKNLVQSVKNERNILAMANNPFVVRFYYSFTSRENLYIVMEYLSGGDLFSLLRNLGALDEEVARQYVAETVLALEYCHTQGIIHRDLKPDNLLISSNGHVKLTDFGLSCFGVIDSTDPHPRAMDLDSGSLPSSPRAGIRPMGHLSPEQLIQSPASKADLQDAARSPRLVAGRDEGRRAVGTPDYLAPELLLGTGHGLEVDWWSLGVILFEMVTGRPPFSADTPEEIFQNILDRQIPWPPEDEMSEECRDLIDRLLALDPKQRLGHRGAGEVKLHLWFRGVGWASLARSKAAFIPALDCETDTSYFSSKQVSQLSMALDLESSKSETDLPQSPISLPGSRASSRTQSHRPSRRQSTVRRRSLRQALAEPTISSFTSRASSGGSADSRHSLNGDAAMSLDADAGGAAQQGPTAAAVAAALLQRHHQRGGGGGPDLLGGASSSESRSGGGGIAAVFGGPSRGHSSASMEVELGLELQGLQGRLPLGTLSDEQEGPPAGRGGEHGGGTARGDEEDGGAGPGPGGAIGSPIGSEASYSSSSEQGSSCGTRLSGEGGEGGEEEGCYMELLGPSGEDPFAEFDRPPDPDLYRALRSATASPEKEGGWRGPGG